VKFPLGCGVAHFPGLAIQWVTELHAPTDPERQNSELARVRKCHRREAVIQALSIINLGSTGSELHRLPREAAARHA
jgi:hypothetical protein